MSDEQPNPAESLAMNADGASFSPRSMCLRCRRALSVCWCEESSLHHSPAELVLLQHPRESRNPIGTARMAHLGVQGSQLRIGVEFAADPAIRKMLSDKARRNVLLYPAPDSRPAELLRDEEMPLRIFIIDGTWWQAKKLWRANAWLRGLPAYRLNPSVAGQYRIRREPAAHCLATIEAVAQLLDITSGKTGDHAQLLRPFNAMVERQIAHAQAPGRTPRIRRRTRVRRVCPQLQELAAVLPRLLLVHGEGNGWPKPKPQLRPGADSGDVELMQWLAIRPATGETFHALVRTRTRAPSVLHNQSLSDADLAGAISKEEFLIKWAAFTRTDDVWCSWGYNPESLLKQAGGATSSTINLQRICNNWFRRRLQDVDQALSALGEPAGIGEFPGRGGRRITQMAATVRALIRQ